MAHFFFIFAVSLLLFMNKKEIRYYCSIKYFLKLESRRNAVYGKALIHLPRTSCCCIKFVSTAIKLLFIPFTLVKNTVLLLYNFFTQQCILCIFYSYIQMKEQLKWKAFSIMRHCHLIMTRSSSALKRNKKLKRWRKLLKLMILITL